MAPSANRRCPESKNTNMIECENLLDKALSEREKILGTSLLDTEKYKLQELGELYQIRAVLRKCIRCIRH
jgi:hypothetical protein